MIDPAKLRYVTIPPRELPGNEERVAEINMRAREMADIKKESRGERVTGPKLSREDYINGWRQAFNEKANDADPKQMFRAAYDGDTMVGFATTKSPKGEDASVGELAGFWVDPDYQRGGVGGRLLSDAVSFLKEKGCTSLMLYADANDSALQKTYTDFGGQRAEKIMEVPGYKGLVQYRWPDIATLDVQSRRTGADVSVRSNKMPDIAPS